MRFSNMLDPIDVGDTARAFIMDDHIEAFGPIRPFVDAEFVVFAIRVAFMNNGPGHIGAGADAFGQDFLLSLVIMATAARDKQSMQRLGGAGYESEKCECRRGEKNFEL